MNSSSSNKGLNSLKQLMRSAAKTRGNPDNLEKQAEAEHENGVSGNNNAEEVSNITLKFQQQRQQQMG